jgi:nucleotidyltransferase substrate binding protein (TIGR01987 family)
MMNQEDIRWEQRFSNFNKALKKLTQAVDFVKQEVLKEDELNEENENEILDEIIKEGLIQRFEYTYELAWNVMKDYAYYQGGSSLEIRGSRDAFRYAFQAGLIENGELWMEMISSRQMTSHTYDEETVEAIYTKIISAYHGAYLQFQKTMEEIRSGEQL